MNLQLIICSNASIKEAADNRKAYERSAVSTSDPTTLTGVAKDLKLYPMGLPWIPAEKKRQALLEVNSHLPKLVEMSLVYFKQNLNPIRLEDVVDPASVILTPPFTPAVNIADLDSKLAQDVTKMISELLKPSDLDGVYQPNWKALDGGLGKVSKVEDALKRFEAIFAPTVAFLRKYVAEQPHNDATRTKARRMLQELDGLVTPTEVAFEQLIAAYKTATTISVSSPLTVPAHYYLLDLDANI
jgi:hypothetical protein